MQKENKLIKCACGCGESLLQFNKHGKLRRYIHHHFDDNIRQNISIAVKKSYDLPDVKKKRQETYKLKRQKKIDGRHIVKGANGYMLVFKPNHKYCRKNGYIPEHRLVVEENIGKIINPKKFHVHHINKVRNDNRIENLMLVKASDHTRIENGWFKKNSVWHKKCHSCFKILPVTPKYFSYRKVSLNKGTTWLSPCKDCQKIIQQNIRDKKIIREIKQCLFCSKDMYITYYKKDCCSKRCATLYYVKIKKEEGTFISNLHEINARRQGFIN